MNGALTPPVAMLLAALFLLPVLLVQGARLAAPPARADEAAALAIPGDTAFGEYLAGACLTCHQASGAYDGIPPITGWPTEIFIAVLYEYRTGIRDHLVMRMHADRLTDEEMAALAAYFASLR